MANADIGIAIKATDIAMQASNIVLMKSNLKDLLTVIHLAKKTVGRIKLNLFWAFVYNFLFIPMAAGGIYYWTGFYMNSLASGAAMACSSIAVVFSSLALNTYKSPYL